MTRSAFLLNLIESAKDYYQEGISVLPTSAGTNWSDAYGLCSLGGSLWRLSTLGNAKCTMTRGDENVKIARLPRYRNNSELIGAQAVKLTSGERKSYAILYKKNKLKQAGFFYLFYFLNMLLAPGWAFS